MARYGLLKLEAAERDLILSVKEPSLYLRLEERYSSELSWLVPLAGQRFLVRPAFGDC